MFVTIVFYVACICGLLQLAHLKDIKQIPCGISRKIDFFGRKIGATLMLGMLLEKIGLGFAATVVSVVIFWLLYRARYYLRAILKTVADYLPGKEKLSDLKVKIEKSSAKLNHLTPTPEENKEAEDAAEDGNVVEMK